jgi:hypothetical protein
MCDSPFVDPLLDPYHALLDPALAPEEIKALNPFVPKRFSSFTGRFPQCRFIKLVL